MDARECVGDCQRGSSAIECITVPRLTCETDQPGSTCQPLHNDYRGSRSRRLGCYNAAHGGFATFVQPHARTVGGVPVVHTHGTDAAQAV
jgi:hypothetical protein